jgi:hypothetical protein
MRSIAVGERHQIRHLALTTSNRCTDVACAAAQSNVAEEFFGCQAECAAIMMSQAGALAAAQTYPRHEFPNPGTRFSCFSYLKNGIIAMNGVKL